VYYFTKFPYVNGMKFHFTKEWNVGDVFNPTGRYELHLKDRIFLYVIFWHLGDVFNLKGEYELHPGGGMFLLVIFWHLGNIFNLKRYEFHPKDRMFLYMIFWHLGDEWRELVFHNSKGCFPSQRFILYKAPISQLFKWPSLCTLTTLITKQKFNCIQLQPMLVIYFSQ